MTVIGILAAFWLFSLAVGLLLEVLDVIAEARGSFDADQDPAGPQGAE